jgi:predicted Fe-S protein YdhL (DUF1289 family)
VAAPASPCTGVCRLNPQEVCVGCGRTLDEIVDWRGADEVRQHAIVAAARERLSIIRRESPDDPVRS